MRKIHFDGRLNRPYKEFGKIYLLPYLLFDWTEYWCCLEIGWFTMVITLEIERKKYA